LQYCVYQPSPQKLAQLIFNPMCCADKSKRIVSPF
jgi:hypothetical protein